MDSYSEETKESRIQQLIKAFPHFPERELNKRNDKQIYNLYHACLDENGQLHTNNRTKSSDKSTLSNED